MTDVEMLDDEVGWNFKELLRCFAFRHGLINRVPWHDIASRTLSQLEPGDWLAHEQHVREELERCG